MRTQKVFEAIVRVLVDGEWHELDELREVSEHADYWTRQLFLEGVVAVQGAPDMQQVRLLPGP